MKRRIKKLLKSYSFEIALFFLISTGLFLLVVDVDLKENIRALINLIYSFTKESFKLISYNLTGGLKIIKLSNLLGFLILIICFYLTFKRWKNRLLLLNHSSKICEKCNSKIYRKKKSNYFKVLEFILRLKIRVFQCENCNMKFKVFKKK